MDIVTLGPRDFDDVADLFSLLDRERYRCTAVGELLPKLEKKHFVGLLVDGKLAGAMCLQEVEQACEIWGIVSQVTGGGAALVNYAIEFCKRSSLHKLWCRSWADYKAQGFYDAMGFEEQYLMRQQWLGKDCWFFGKAIELSD